MADRRTHRFTHGSKVSPAFVLPLRELNLEASKHKLKGIKSYIKKADVRKIYHQFRGHCALCGKNLRAGGQTEFSVRFMFRTPLKRGGEAKAHNVIPVCMDCKHEKSTPSRLVSRQIDYNSIADLIAQLVYAVKGGQLERIRFFKRELDIALEETFDAMVYQPVGLHDKAQPVLDDENNVGHLVERMAQDVSTQAEIAATLESASIERSYKPLKRWERL